MKVSAKVRVRRAVTGQQIMDAAQAVAGNDYYKEMEEVNDDATLYDVGRNSGYPYEDCRILAEGGFLDPDMAYSDVEVVYLERGGQKYMVGYSNQDIVEAVRGFRDKLQAALNDSN